MPQMRTFGLNSREFYEAGREPDSESWIRNGSLPREPRGREMPVIVEGNEPRWSRN